VHYPTYQPAVYLFLKTAVVVKERREINNLYLVPVIWKKE